MYLKERSVNVRGRRRGCKLCEVLCKSRPDKGDQQSHSLAQGCGQSARLEVGKDGIRDARGRLMPVTVSYPADDGMRQIDSN